MKYCPNCGTEIKEGATFCSKCGTKTSTGKKPVEGQPVNNTNAQKFYVFDTNSILGLLFGV